jgi:hypothetical protein
MIHSHSKDEVVAVHLKKSVADLVSRTLLHFTTVFSCNFAHIRLKHAVGNDWRLLLPCQLVFEWRWSLSNEDGGSIIKYSSRNCAWWVCFINELLCTYNWTRVTPDGHWCSGSSKIRQVHMSWHILPVQGAVVVLDGTGTPETRQLESFWGFGKPDACECHHVICLGKNWPEWFF